MKSTFALNDGCRIVITTIHAAQVVCVEKFYGSGLLQASMHIPAAMGGVISQALAVAAQKVETGPCAPASGLRCHDVDACAAGQRPCPTPKACGVTG